MIDFLGDEFSRRDYSNYYLRFFIFVNKNIRYFRDETLIIKIIDLFLIIFSL